MSVLLSSFIHHVEARMRLLGALTRSFLRLSSIESTREMLEGADTSVELAENGSGDVSRYNYASNASVLRLSTLFISD